MFANNRCIKLSVITINYNNSEGLRKTIESVVNQTYKNFEYIVIDGGSTDGSVDVIKEYADRIDYWVSEPDKGIYHAMNKGVDKAGGEYCIFMNSGDCFYESETIDEVLKLDPTEDILCGDTYLSIGYVRLAPQIVTLQFLFEESLSHQSSLIKTELLKEIKYDENLKIVADFEFFLRTLIINDATYRRIDRIVAFFDCNGISNTNSRVNSKERKLVLEKMFPPRVLYDYRKNRTDDFRRLFFFIEKTNFHSPIYIINVLIIKVLSLFTGSKWAKGFRLRENANK